MFRSFNLFGGGGGIVNMAAVDCGCASFECYADATAQFVAYFGVVVVLCALLRYGVCLNFCDRALQPRLLEAIACGELYACALGHARVAVVFGPETALMSSIALGAYRSCSMEPGTTGNALSYGLAFVSGRCCVLDLNEMIRRLGLQIGASLVSHVASTFIWQGIMSDHPPAAVAMLHCCRAVTIEQSPGSMMRRAVVEGLGTLILVLFTMRAGTVIVDKYELVTKSLIETLVLVGGVHVDVFLNPIAAAIQLVGCTGTSFAKYSFVHWLLPAAIIYFLNGCPPEGWGGAPPADDPSSAEETSGTDSSESNHSTQEAPTGGASGRSGAANPGAAVCCQPAIFSCPMATQLMCNRPRCSCCGKRKPATAKSTSSSTGGAGSGGGASGRVAGVGAVSRSSSRQDGVAGTGSSSDAAGAAGRKRERGTKPESRLERCDGSSISSVSSCVEADGEKDDAEVDAAAGSKHDMQPTSSKDAIRDDGGKGKNGDGAGAAKGKPTGSGSETFQPEEEQLRKRSQAPQPAAE